MFFPLIALTSKYFNYSTAGINYYILYQHVNGVRKRLRIVEMVLEFYYVLHVGPATVDLKRNLLIRFEQTPRTLCRSRFQFLWRESLIIIDNRSSEQQGFLFLVTPFRRAAG